MKKNFLLIPCLFLLTFSGFSQTKNTRKASSKKAKTYRPAAIPVVVPTNDIKTYQPPVTPVAPVQQSNALRFDEPIHKFGTVKQGEVLKYKFKFTNVSSKPVDVTNATATCGCTVPDYPFISILPNETGEIGVSFNTMHKLGHQKPIVTVTTTSGTYQVVMEGEVE
jgi:hypothetical protein